MNTPIYLALLGALFPVAKERLLSCLARAALADQAPAERPHLRLVVGGVGLERSEQRQERHAA